MKTVNQKDIFLGLFFSGIYFFLSLYWSQKVNIYGDTLEYYYAFLNVNNITFPWHLEYFTSTLMFFLNHLGADFRGFLFINYLLWLPLVYYIFSKSRKDIFVFFIGLFFLSYIFFNNAAFLIRQFNAFLFFIYLLLAFNHGLRYLFLVLMLTSHLSSLIFLIFYFEKISNVILKYRKIIFLIFLLLLFFNVNFIVEFLINFSSDVAGFDRKLSSVSGYVNTGNDSKIFFVFLNFIIVAIIVFSNKFYPVKKMNRFFATILISSMLYVVFRNEPILANRVAFVSYSFIIPGLFLVLRRLYVK
jgi:hypothetical protein